MSVIVYKSDGEYNLWLISEFMTSDLEKLIRDTKIILTEDDIRKYMYQILKGLEFMHLNWYLHRYVNNNFIICSKKRSCSLLITNFYLRDLAPSNILISSTGQLKIGLYFFFILI